MGDQGDRIDILGENPRVLWFTSPDVISRQSCAGYAGTPQADAQTVVNRMPAPPCPTN